MKGNDRRVLLLGSNSGRNAGDLAILETVIEEIGRRRPGTVFEVPTTNPGFIGRHFRGKPVVPLSIMPWNLSVRLLGLPVLRSMRRCDLTLILDGIIFDHRLLNPAFNFLNTLAFLAPLARRWHRPLVCFEVGVGPLKTALGRKCARIVGQASDLIMVRETDSERLLREAGVTTPIELYADAVFILTPASPARIDEIVAGLDSGGRPMVGLNLNRYGGEWVGDGVRIERRPFQRQMAEFIDRFTGETGAVVVLTATHHMDYDYLKEVAGLARNAGAVRFIGNLEHTPAELAGVMGRMEMFIGTRLHSLILASSVRTPILGLTYAPKVRSLFRLMDRPDLAMDLGRVEAPVLLEKVLDFRRRLAEERERFGRTADGLKERAAAGFDRLAERYF